VTQQAALAGNLRSRPKDADLTPFAFIIHPLSLSDVARKFPIAKYLPDRVIEAFIMRKKPMVVSEVKGIQSKTGATTKGWLIGCPLTPQMMTDRLPLEAVYERIVQSIEVAHQAGAKIVGLGAYTSVVGDGGITIAERSPIPVTTGNSYTVATAIQGTVEALRLLEVDPAESTLAVVGATGSIGRTCAMVLAPQFKNTLLVGRNQERTEEIAKEVPRSSVTTDMAAIKNADAIITVTSTDAAVIEPEHLKSGCVVCDVARPRDVSVRVGKTRPDVLVIEGGVVAVPGDVDFGLNFGFEPKTAYACMSETIMLALDDRPESFTLGKTVSVEQVQETMRLAEKHGFKLAGFRSFERPVNAEVIDRVKAARRAAVGV
jgi:fatty aldehyde-generating acyl-ACP reductase